MADAETRYVIDRAQPELKRKTKKLISKTQTSSSNLETKKEPHSPQPRPFDPESADPELNPYINWIGMIGNDEEVRKSLVKGAKCFMCLDQGPPRTFKASGNKWWTDGISGMLNSVFGVETGSLLHMLAKEYGIGICVSCSGRLRKAYDFIECSKNYAELLKQNSKNPVVHLHAFDKTNGGTSTGEYQPDLWVNRAKHADAVKYIDGRKPRDPSNIVEIAEDGSSQHLDTLPQQSAKKRPAPDPISSAQSFAFTTEAAKAALRPIIINAIGEKRRKIDRRDISIQTDIDLTSFKPLGGTSHLDHSYTSATAGSGNQLTDHSYVSGAESNVMNIEQKKAPDSASQNPTKPDEPRDGVLTTNDLSIAEMQTALTVDESTSPTGKDNSGNVGGSLLAVIPSSINVLDLNADTELELHVNSFGQTKLTTVTKKKDSRPGLPNKDWPILDMCDCCRTQIENTYKILESSEFDMSTD